MDWIEKLFHVSPDHGNGFFEYVIVAAVALAVAYPLRHRLLRLVRPARLRMAEVLRPVRRRIGAPVRRFFASQP